MEITQFTYFQQVGGQNLDPVSVELTYGIERIMMALQGVTHFKDMEYASGISYGEAFGQSEYEMSRYYLDDADIQTNRDLFERYTAEAQRLIDVRLPVPAHTYVLKSSHASTSSTRAVPSRRRSARRAGMMRRPRAGGVPPVGGAARGARLPVAVERAAADAGSCCHAALPWC